MTTKYNLQKTQKEVLLKAPVSKTEPTVSRTQQNKNDSLLKTSQKQGNAIKQDSTGRRNEQKVDPKQMIKSGNLQNVQTLNKNANDNAGKKSNEQNKLSKSLIINTNQSRKNVGFENTMATSLPTGQLGKIQNGISLGQQNRGYGQNNQPIKGTVPNKGNRPQPDGQVPKNQTLQKTPAIKELPQKGNQSSSNEKTKPTAKKQDLQSNNGPKNQQSNVKIQQAGQKSQQADSKQVSTQNQQKAGAKQSLQQKDNIGQTGQKMKMEKPGVVQSNVTKSQQITQKSNGQKQVVAQKAIQNGQRLDSQKPDKTQNSQKTATKGDNQKPNVSQKPQQNGQKTVQQTISDKLPRTGQKQGTSQPSNINSKQNEQKAKGLSTQTTPLGKNNKGTVPGQKTNQQKTAAILDKNTKNTSNNNTTKQPLGKPGIKDQNGKQAGKNGQNVNNVQNIGNTDKRKKKKKQMERRRPPERPQIIEYPAGVTAISLAEAQILLDEIDEIRGDRQFGALADFLNQLFQKVQNLETGNYSRTEVELFVRQFQDFNEGFHYRMESKPRGHALILTNSKFYQVPGDPWSYNFDDRPGAEIDADNLEKLFTDMGYLVTRRDDIKHWEMKWELKCIADMDHKKFDSFICVISSHGNLNQVYGCDGLRMILSKQIRQFRSENCPTLAGKPKMFFLQSCQTDEDEQILRTESTVPTDPNVKPKPGELERSRFLINDVDFVVGYSTIPGNHSYRHENTGSWYLNSLYKNLKENYTKYDIVSILEDVNYDVSCKRDDYNYLDSNQVSMFSSTLRGPLFFH